MTEREAYILLNMMKDVGPVSVRALAAALGGVAAIPEAPAEALGRVAGVSRTVVEAIVSQRSALDVAAEAERAAAAGAHLVTPVDAEYPAALAKIYDPPLALYVQGTLEARDRGAVAVVGTRRPSHYGREWAERLSFELAQAGFVVASGLAEGVDTVAHRGALKGKGRTLAVTAGGLDRLYPASNAGLAEEIARQGAVITEYPFGRDPDRTTFPVRNRIVSGLSSAVLVVEAGLKSGALITANVAAEQGRTVFALPGRIDSPASQGTNNLLKQGAVLVTGIEDILDEFEFLLPPARRAPARAGVALSEDEARVVRVLEDGELDVDSLIRAAGLKPATVNSLLIGMEMKKILRSLPGRRVERVRSTPVSLPGGGQE